MRKFVARIATTYVSTQKFVLPKVRYGFCQAKELHEFKTETKKLLDIVAKSLYTDKDVFLRELLSNASDALEKQRFLASQKGIDVAEELEIKIDLDEQKRTITIEDSGVGMTKQEMMDNLGTIARSGSKQFLEQVGDQMNDKIIGQFGVGFYSSFIVGDTVEVISKSERSDKTYIWVSDGSGTFTISEATDQFLGRGTRIVIYLKPDAAKYTKKSDIISTVQRYSNFISFPIQINGERQNLVQAIWSRNKSEVTGEEYNKFYEYISNSKLSYKYKLHYSTDAPLSIKALLYIPSTHMEKYGMQFEEFDVHLYSKKILIKKNCRELLPNFLRFVKGVVDCEDLPLNISRENYQDSALIAKLKSIISKRVIREIENQANQDPTSYLAWYNDFNLFLKEGIAMDDEHRESLTKLIRFQTNKSEDMISLDDYLAQLPQGTNSIYYFLAPNRQMALQSPYMEPFQNTDIPIILTYNHLDEVVFKQINQYNKKQFINIESEHHEIDKINASKQTEKKTTEQDEAHIEEDSTIPTDEVSPFCMWMKNELAPIVSQVSVSKRLRSSPAIVTSQITSGMRQVMQAMGQGQEDTLKNLTLEINPNNLLIVQLNKVRKSNRVMAGLAAKQILDGCLLTAGLLRDPKGTVERTHQLLSAVLHSDMKVGELSGSSEPYREQPSTENSNKKQEELDTEIVIDEDGNPKVVRKQNK